MIPKVINFIFGLREDFCGKPFQYFHYLNILSAKKVNPNYTINVYYYYKPESVFFNNLYTFCNVIKLDKIPDILAGQKIKWGEHACGYLRVNKLLEEGGIYLDTDVVCIKSFDDLLDENCILGLEFMGQVNWGLCDAVILAKKGSKFLSHWKDNYDTKYASNDWSKDAVQVPFELAIKYPKTIRMVPPDFFFKYPWGEIGSNLLFNAIAPLEYAYCLHQYESTQDQFKKLCNYNDEKYIFSHNSTLSYIYRKIIWGDQKISFPEKGNYLMSPNS
jgi:hypothetical protein